MPYQHKTDKGIWNLYTREVTLNGGRKQVIFFFSRGKPKSGKQTDMPKGYKVLVTKRTGLPVLKKA
ncbi:MAG: hypothetical protein ACYDCK_01725 [Thermoplasmatota archaeon]